MAESLNVDVEERASKERRLDEELRGLSTEQVIAMFMKEREEKEAERKEKEAALHTLRRAEMLEGNAGWSPLVFRGAERGVAPRSFRRLFPS